MNKGHGRPPVLSPLEEGKLVSYLTEGDYQIWTPQFNEKVQELAVERAVALKKNGNTENFSILTSTSAIS